MENLTTGLNYIQKEMNIKLMGIGPDGIEQTFGMLHLVLILFRHADIHAGNLKHVLSLIWRLFNGVQLNNLNKGRQGFEALCCGCVHSEVTLRSTVEWLAHG